MDKIGIGIIGSGGIARGAHLPGYRALEKEGVKIVAVCDVDEATAKRAAAEFNVDRANRQKRKSDPSPARKGNRRIANSDPPSR